MALELTEEELDAVLELARVVEGEWGEFDAGEDAYALLVRIHAHRGLPAPTSRQQYLEMARETAGPPGPGTPAPDGMVWRLVDGIWELQPTARRHRDPLADIYANPELFEAT